jgi:hypothetical protein
MSDMDGGSIWGDIGKSVAPIAIDVGSQALKNYLGSGIHGVRASGKSLAGGDLDMPIQLGSPYQHIGSPAMNPFIPSHSQLSGFNPLPKTTGGVLSMGQGINPPGGYGINPPGMYQSGRGVRRGKGSIGSTIGSILGNFLPF